MIDNREFGTDCGFVMIVERCCGDRPGTGQRSSDDLSVKVVPAIHAQTRSQAQFLRELKHRLAIRTDNSLSAAGLASAGCVTGRKCCLLADSANLATVDTGGCK